MSETPLTVHAVDAEISPGLQHSRDALHHALLGDRQLRTQGERIPKGYMSNRWPGFQMP